MNRLRDVWSEVVGLFVDDGSLAIAVVAWLTAVRLLLGVLGSWVGWAPWLLFAGLGAILLENVLRRAGRAG